MASQMQLTTPGLNYLGKIIYSKMPKAEQMPKGYQRQTCLVSDFQQFN